MLFQISQSGFLLHVTALIKKSGLPAERTSDNQTSTFAWWTARTLWYHTDRKLC